MEQTPHAMTKWGLDALLSRCFVMSPHRHCSAIFRELSVILDSGLPLRFLIFTKSYGMIFNCFSTHTLVSRHISRLRLSNPPSEMLEPGYTQISRSKIIAESAPANPKCTRTDANQLRNGRSDRLLHRHVRPVPLLGDLPPPAAVSVKEGAAAILRGCQAPYRRGHINLLERVRVQILIHNPESKYNRIRFMISMFCPAKIEPITGLNHYPIVI